MLKRSDYPGKLTAWLRLRKGRCPMCNSEAPACRTCPVCRGVGSYEELRADGPVNEDELRRIWRLMLRRRLRLCLS